MTYFHFFVLTSGEITPEESMTRNLNRIMERSRHTFGATLKNESQTSQNFEKSKKNIEKFE